MFFKPGNIPARWDWFVTVVSLVTADFRADFSADLASLFGVGLAFSLDGWDGLSNETSILLSRLRGVIDKVSTVGP